MEFAGHDENIDNGDINGTIFSLSISISITHQWDYYQWVINENIDNGYLTSNMVCGWSENVLYSESQLHADCE